MNEKQSLQPQWGSMDLFHRWSQRIREYPFPNGHSSGGNMDDVIHALLEQHTTLWWAQQSSFPKLPFLYSPKQHIENDRLLDLWVNGLAREIKQIPATTEGRQDWQERLRPPMLDFARKALNLEQRHIDFIESTGMARASQEFARMARQFDPGISAEDIYQAGRNVMTMNFLQLLLDLPVEVTPSVFAYSMLYPYTDNYLDNPDISRNTKLAFNHRFAERLRGEVVRPANAYETPINNLVGMIETQWERSRYPQVYESLQAIHAAQARSMNLVAPGASPYELDVLSISFEKGGTSVLADGYLVAGWMTPEQASFMFGYGSFTQLMDDLEDLEQDMREGSMTIFSQTAGRWPMDGITNRMMHFGHAIFGDLSVFHSEAAGGLQEIIDRGMDGVLIDVIGRASKYYSKRYMGDLERHTPFRFASVRKQRERLARQKIHLGRLVETLL